MHRLPNIIFILPILLLLSGCGKRFVNWGKETFNQADEVSVKSSIDVARKYVKTVRLYDEFTTLGIFDVLWLSDDVRRAYTQLYTTKRGLDEQTYQSIEQRQLAINNHRISFYVLAYQPHEPKLKLLDNAESNWSIYLKNNKLTLLRFSLLLSTMYNYFTFYIVFNLCCNNLV